MIDARRYRASEVEQLELFHGSLSAYCRADVPLGRALDALVEELGRGPVRDAVEQFARDVEGGTPLGEAYAARGDVFPPLYCAMVEAGIASGDLPGMLEEIAVHAGRQREIAARLDRALAYPILAASVVAALGMVLLATVAPALRELGETMHTGTAMRGWVFVTAVHVFSWIACALVALLLIGAFVARRAGWRAAVGPRMARAALRIPLLGRLRRDAAVVAFASTLGALLRRSVPLPRALELTTAACDGFGVGDEVAAMQAAAAAGDGLPESIRAGGLLPPSLGWIVDAAAARGEGAEALLDVAASFRRRLERGVDHISLVLTPLAEIVIGVAVFLLAYAFIVPLIQYTGWLVGDWY